MEYTNLKHYTPPLILRNILLCRDVVESSRRKRLKALHLLHLFCDESFFRPVFCEVTNAFFCCNCRIPVQGCDACGSSEFARIGESLVSRTSNMLCILVCMKWLTYSCGGAVLLLRYRKYVPLKDRQSTPSPDSFSTRTLAVE